MIIKNCKKCLKKFETYRKKAIFCSKKCAWNNKIEKKCEICNEKMMVYPCLIKRKRFCSIECKRKGIMTEDVKNKIRAKLELPDHELKNLRTSKRIKRWSKEVFKINSKECKKCGKKEGLVAHHIKNIHDFPLVRYEVMNGEILCRSCHINIHRK